jgi:hypothetical protein
MRAPDEADRFITSAAFTKADDFENGPQAGTILSTSSKEHAPRSIIVPFPRGAHPSNRW